ncbi:M14 family zinc carboxypeptidase [Draconibacterium sediminis]|nr:M14 family zinc carboxypeptidase [Draconibacterium sediminis]
MIIKGLFLRILLLLIMLTGCSDHTNRIKKVQSFECDDTYTLNLYPVIDELYARLNRIHKNFPGNTELFRIGRSARLHKPIPLIRIGYTGEDTESRFLIVAGTHGDEAAPVTALLYFMARFLDEGNGQKISVQKISVDIILIHNPDGYIENERENGKGIDLNRNFPFGSIEKQPEPETVALINLINQNKYKASLFLHSGNENIYENLVRVPIENNKLGQGAFYSSGNAALTRLRDMIIAAGGSAEPPWRSSSEMVNSPGIASDWCTSGFMMEELIPIGTKTCLNPHPSVTLEICSPKQPLNEGKLKREEEELYGILNRVIYDF